MTKDSTDDFVVDETKDMTTSASDCADFWAEKVLAGDAPIWMALYIATLNGATYALGRQRIGGSMKVDDDRLLSRFHRWSRLWRNRSGLHLH